MYNYAQLNGNNIVIGVSALSGIVTESHMIPIDVLDYDLIGKYYNNATGVFE